jgi:hypothetical protein
VIARVYHAINAVAAAMAHDGVAKTRLNSHDNYLYRSIDDVLERLAPLLAQHRLCILPRVLNREAVDRQDESGGLLVSVTLRVGFDLVCAEDGSAHTIEAYGEALDQGDKATAKAMQSAYKYAVLQAFCVPAAQLEDADARTHRIKVAQLIEPVEGWASWSENLREAVAQCADLLSIEQLQDEHRSTLASLARERPELYNALGQAFAGHKAEFANQAPQAQRRHKSGGDRRDGGPQGGPDHSGPARRHKRSTRNNGSGAHA